MRSSKPEHSRRRAFEIYCWYLDESGVMENAAERLLGLQRPDVHALAHDIIVGQMRLVVAMMDIEEINTNRDNFLQTLPTTSRSN